MSSIDLRSEFKVSQVDQSELEQLLQSHFGGATGVSPEEVQYARSGATTPDLTLYYSADGGIRRIEPGLSLDAVEIGQIVDKIEKLLLTPSAPHIGQLVLFSSLKVGGWFRYRDAFQLVPMTGDAPQPKFGLADHPLLLQFRVHGSEDMLISMLRRSQVSRELELLCAALTTGISGASTYVSKHHWVMIRDEQDGSIRSEFCAEGYTWPGANGIATNGYTNVSELEPIPLAPADSYYKRRGVSIGQMLDLPDAFEELLNTYFAADRNIKDRFMRAAYWYQYARRVAHISRSGAYTALVSAIEALMGESTPGAACASCNRPLGAGPTKRFIEFVERHAPGSGTTAKDRRQLYALRSALSHGGTILSNDRHSWGGMSSVFMSEWNDQMAMWMLGRVILVNWLSEQKGSSSGI